MNINEPQRFTLTNVQPDPLDPNDTLYPVDFTVQLPDVVDLRPFAPPIEDQTSVGDCTANALVGNCGFFLRANGKFAQLAEDFNYFTSRYLLNGNKAPTGDTGSTPGMALKAARQFGVCLESSWPISTTPAVFNSQPPANAYAEALNYKVGSYQRLQNPLPTDVPWWNSDYWWISFLYVLAKGYPINIALNVGDAIFSLKGDTLYEPLGTGNAWAGAHDVLVVGYSMTGGDMLTLKLLCRNSWGTGWGDQGYFWMSPSVLTSDVFSAYVQESFAGFTQIGPDLTKRIPAPTEQSTMAQVVEYVFKVKFGRTPLPAGEGFWSAAVAAWLVNQICADASPVDMAYMHANPVAARPVFTDTQSIVEVVETTFQTYFGRKPLPTGAAFWAAEALERFTMQIVASAAFNDKRFMADNNIS